MRPDPSQVHLDTRRRPSTSDSVVQWYRLEVTICQGPCVSRNPEKQQSDLHPTLIGGGGVGTGANKNRRRRRRPKEVTHTINVKETNVRCFPSVNNFPTTPRSSLTSFSTESFPSRVPLGVKIPLVRRRKVPED